MNKGSQSANTANEKSGGILHTNPLLADLHLPDTDQEIIKAIANDPFRNPDWLASHQNVRQIKTYLQAVVIPTPKTIKISCLIFEMIHAGYIARDPWDAGIMREYNSATPSLDPVQHTGVGGGVIQGITGHGKTHRIKAALRSLPQIVVRNSSIPSLKKASQIVYLYVEMTTATSLEALLLEITTQIDDLLQEGGRLIREFETKGRLLESKMNSVLRSMRTYFVGILVIDEIQRLNFAMAPARIRQFLMKVMNSSIPVLLSGNPLGFKFFEKMEDGEKGEPSQLWRRLTAYGNIRLDPCPEPDDKDVDPELKALLRGLWRCRLKPENIPLDDSFYRLFWWGSGGFPDFLVKIWAGLQEHQSTAHTRQLDESVIDHVLKGELCSLRVMIPLIEAFRNRDVIALRHISDVDWEYYAELWRHPNSSKPNEKSAGGVGPGTLMHEPTSSEDRIDPKDVINGRKRVSKARATKADNKTARANNPNLQNVVESNLKGLASMIGHKDGKDS